MQMIIYFKTAVLIGLIIGLIVDGVFNRKNAKKFDPNIEKYIAKTIAPNNDKKDIDLIIRNLKQNNIDPIYTIDSFSHKDNL